MTIIEKILHILAANGGKFLGTGRMITQIPADEKDCKRALSHARKQRLITSIHSHGGRGHVATHYLTRKGIEYVTRSH
jgi:hypothetical protein